MQVQASGNRQNSYKLFRNSVWKMKPTRRKTPGKSVVNTLVNGKLQIQAMDVGLVERNVLLLICFSREIGGGRE